MRKKYPTTKLRFIKKQDSFLIVSVRYLFFASAASNRRQKSLYFQVVRPFSVPSLSVRPAVVRCPLTAISPGGIVAQIFIKWVAIAEKVFSVRGQFDIHCTYHISASSCTRISNFQIWSGFYRAAATQPLYCDEQAVCPSVRPSVRLSVCQTREL